MEKSNTKRKVTLGQLTGEVREVELLFRSDHKLIAMVDRSDTATGFEILRVRLPEDPEFIASFGKNDFEAAYKLFSERSAF